MLKNNSPDHINAHSTPNAAIWHYGVPGVFVIFWSTGFLGAKFGLPYAEPLTFLSLRFAIVAVFFLLISLVIPARWPGKKMALVHAAIVGILIHGFHLGGVFCALFLGVSTGVTALIVSVHPILTAIFSGPILGEGINSRHWLGLILGFLGIGLVLFDKLLPLEANINGIVACIVGALGMTFGTLYQKRFSVEDDLCTSSVIQFSAAATLLWLLACVFESRNIEWTNEFLFALGWLVLVLSIGAATLLLFLIRIGRVIRLVSLFYLVPPLVAVEAYVLFNESLGFTAIVGIIITTVGVFLVVKQGTP
ncbi:MAG: hypothetical protein CFH06_00987 [Alphaproteobacteria bacterium MarineAlpha3_Bin5]|nr:MAG: hypothetical protein CFH06_00987 [Alphaproteobacteria bacterium MarineAlpha3_Bin5]